MSFVRQNIIYDSGKGLVFSLCNSRFGALNDDEELEKGGRIRDGAMHDVAIVNQCFGSSLFDVDFQQEFDLTYDKTMDALCRLRGDIRQKRGVYKFLFILLNSHGSNDSLITADNRRLSILEDVVEPFNNNNFPELSGRPKIFVLNCCRGSLNHQLLVESPKHDSGIRSSKPLNPFVSPNGDICVIWSTTRDALSPRYNNVVLKGSPLIQWICKMMINASKQNDMPDFSSFLLKVKKSVRKEFDLQIEIQDALGMDFYLPSSGHLDVKKFEEMSNKIKELQKELETVAEIKEKLEQQLKKSHEQKEECRKEGEKRISRLQNEMLEEQKRRKEEEERYLARQKQLKKEKDQEKQRRKEQGRKIERLEQQILAKSESREVIEPAPSTSTPVVLPKVPTVSATPPKSFTTTKLVPSIASKFKSPGTKSSSPTQSSIARDPYTSITVPRLNTSGKPNQKLIVFGYQGRGKSTLLNSVAGSIIFQSGPSSGGLKKKVEEITVGNTTYCDAPGFEYQREEEWSEAITKLLHLGGTCKIVFVVKLWTTVAGGWIEPIDYATMRVILDAAPEIGKSFGVILNRCSQEQINTLANSKGFAENTFKCIKPEHHHRSIHLMKRYSDLENKNNCLIKGSEIEDLKEFLENKVPTIELTRNRSNDVDVDKVDEYDDEYIDERNRALGW